MSICFEQAQLEAIAAALGDTNEGVTGTEIGHLLTTCKIEDTHPNLTKRKRLFNAFAHNQNNCRHRKCILAFIRKAMKPERFLNSPERFEPMRARLNCALAFAGLAVDESGRLHEAEKVQTLSDARRRAQELRADLVSRGVHSDVLRPSVPI